MKRRSNPKGRKGSNYGAKLRNPSKMMYGPTRHRDTHPRVAGAK